MIIYYNELGKKGLEPSNYLKSYFEYDAYTNFATYLIIVRSFILIKD